MKWFTNKFWRIALDWVTPEEASSYRDFALKNWCLRRLGARLGENVAIGRRFDHFIHRSSALRIDDHVNISNDVAIYAFKEVVIGSFTAIASHCVFANGTHDISTHAPRAGRLVIGRGVFIGLGARIIGSVTIGDNALIAAGATVVSDVAPGMVVAGSPAKSIGRRPLARRVWHFPDLWYDPETFALTDAPTEDARPLSQNEP
jgi:acetyltransferase-like isoleucine patch superfamily enzyme